MRNKKAILGFELVAPRRDLGLGLGESRAVARRKRVRSWSSSGKEMGGDGGGGRMFGAK